MASVTLASCGAQSTPTGDAPLTVGLVTNNRNGLRNIEGFVAGMADLGYVEGTDVVYRFSGAPLTGSDLDSALADMVRAGVDVIFTAGTPTGVAAHRATEGTAIPVVFGVIADPIRAGVMNDLNAPGGNLTGVKLGQDQDRRLELLLEIAPGVERVYVPFNPDDAAAASAVSQVVDLAPDLGIDLVLGEARSSDEVADLLAAFPEDADAIFLVPDSTVNAHLAEILAIATELRLPTSGPSTAQVEEGALTSYGFVHHAAGAQAARIADQVLRGADPGELPVEDTESFLAVNLATASAIGLEISDEILRQAEVIVRSGDGR